MQQTSEFKRLIVSTHLNYPNQPGIKTRNTIGMILVNLLLSEAKYKSIAKRPNNHFQSHPGDFLLASRAILE
jgi:hypothetical protein